MDDIKEKYDKIKDAFLWIVDGMLPGDLVYITGMPEEKAKEIIGFYESLMKEDNE